MALRAQYYGARQPHVPHQEHPQSQPSQQYPTYAPYAQPPAQMPPPPSAPKRKVWPIIVSIVIVIVVVLAVLLFFILQQRTMTYKQFLLEYDKDGDGDLTASDYPMIPRTLKEGDTVNINDKVVRVETASSQSYGTVTGLWMESTENTNFEDFPLVVGGDKTDQYHVGDAITISLHLKRYAIPGFGDVVVPEEWYTYLMASSLIGGGVVRPRVSFSQASLGTGTATVDIASVDPAGKDIGEFKAVLWKDGATPGGTISPLSDGGSDLNLTFTDKDGDGTLSVGDRFTITTVPSTDYELTLYYVTEKIVSRTFSTL